MCAKMTKSLTKAMFQFRIILNGMKPVVWRRIIVSADLTFSKFAFVVLRAMGWNMSHAMQFKFMTPQRLVKGNKSRTPRRLLSFPKY